MTGYFQIYRRHIRNTANGGDFKCDSSEGSSGKPINVTLTEEQEFSPVSSIQFSSGNYSVSHEEVMNKCSVKVKVSQSVDNCSVSYEEVMKE